MPTLWVNGYDMAFVERGTGAPLLLVHGTLCDYRHWTGQMEPFGAHYRTIAVSLRHCWPEKWDGEGDDFTVQQHTRDVASFIAALRRDRFICSVTPGAGISLSGRRRIILISSARSSWLSPEACWRRISRPRRLRRRLR